MTFELILLQTQRRSNWLDEFFCYIILYVEVLASNFYSVFCTVYSGQELCPVIFPYQPQKIVVPLCLVYQVRGIQKNVATLMQVTMEALLAELLAVMGDFHCHPRVVRILRRSCRITPQSNSPMPVLPTMQSDDVRQEDMATVLNINIPLKCFKRKRFIHSTIAELQVSMAV